MPDVLDRNTKELITSVDLSLYPIANYIHNPNLSAVAGFASKYRIITGDDISLMSQAERDAVDLAEAEVEKDNMSANIDRVLTAVVLAINDGSFVPGANYTNLQLKTIIRGKL